MMRIVGAALQRSICNSIMNRSCFKYSDKQIIPKTLNLHVLLTYKSQINQHIQTNQKLNDPTCMLIVKLKKQKPNSNRCSNLTEI